MPYSREEMQKRLEGKAKRLQDQQERKRLQDRQFQHELKIANMQLKKQDELINAIDNVDTKHDKKNKSLNIQSWVMFAVSSLIAIAGILVGIFL